MWTYYKQDHGNGAWSLFREDERAEESFNRRNGWQPTDQLLVRRSKGDIDRSDIITEAEAEALIQALPPAEPG